MVEKSGDDLYREEEDDHEPVEDVVDDGAAKRPLELAPVTNLCGQKRSHNNKIKYDAWLKYQLHKVLYVQLT